CLRNNFWTNKLSYNAALFSASSAGGGAFIPEKDESFLGLPVGRLWKKSRGSCRFTSSRSKRTAPVDTRLKTRKLGRDVPQTEYDASMNEFPAVLRFYFEGLKSHDVDKI